MKNEVQVNVVDLIKYILMQWKKILIAGICGMLLISGVYLVIGLTNDSSKESATDSVDEDISLEELSKELTDDEIVQVEEAVDFYLSSKENYNQLKNYTANSLLYKIDATHTPTYRIAYVVEGVSASGNKEIQDEVFAILESWINSDEVIQNVMNYIDLQVEHVYVKELISLRYDLLSDCFVLSIVSPEEELTKQIASALDIAIVNKINSLDLYQQLEVRKLSEEFSIETNHTIQSTQSNMMQQLHSALSVLTVYRYDLEDNQQAYYDALLSEKLDSEDIVTEEESERALFDVKIAFLGVIAGVFVMLFYILMKYLLSDALKIKEDISITFHQHVFGEFALNNVDENEWAILCDNVKYAGEKKAAKKLIVAGTCLDNDAIDFKVKLKNNLLKSFEEVEIVSIDKNSPNAIRSVQDSEAVVCVEKLKKSSYTQIQQEIELCEYYDVPVLGFVLVK